MALLLGTRTLLGTSASLLGVPDLTTSNKKLRSGLLASLLGTRTLHSYPLSRVASPPTEAGLGSLSASRGAERAQEEREAGHGGV